MVFMGGPTPHEISKNLSKMTFLMVPRPLALHALRSGPCHEFWKGFGTRGDDFQRFPGGDGGRVKNSDFGGDGGGYHPVQAEKKIQGLKKNKGS